MVSQRGLVVGALVGAAALASAGLFLISVDALVEENVFRYLITGGGGVVWRVAGPAVALALVMLVRKRMSPRGLFLGAVISSSGLAIVAALLLLMALDDSRRPPGVAGLTLGLFVVTSWWASDGGRSRHYLQTSAMLAALLATFFLVLAAQSLHYSHLFAVLEYLVRPGTPFPAACGTGVSQALAGGGNCLLCVSLLALLETCCWARRAAGERPV